MNSQMVAPKDLASRIKERRELVGFKSNRELARHANVDYSVLQQLESGKRTSSKYLPKVAKALKTSADYLMTGVVSLPSCVTTQDGKHKDLEIHKISGGAVPVVPILDWTEAVTWRGLPSSGVYERNYDMVPVFGYGKSGANSFALIVKNDSMISEIANSDSFRPGDVITLDPDKVAVAGNFVVASIKEGEECVFRQLIKVSGKETLMPLNPAYEHEPMGDHITILGVLTDCYRQYG